MNGRIRTGLKIALTAAFCALWACLLLIPAGVRVGAAGEGYACVWSDGSQSRAEYPEAYEMLAGVSDAGDLILERNGVRGEISSSERFRSLIRTLDAGGLNALLGLATSDVGRLERAALWREYRDRLWFAGEGFRYTGERVARSETARCEAFILLSGTVTSDVLASAGAKRLEIRAEAEFSASALLGTEIAEVTACTPYRAEGGALYLDTVGGARLIAGLPKAKALTVSGNAFADRGALLPCGELVELTLPFVGSAASPAGSEYNGLFAWLFSDGEEYFVPESLKRVTVTGGVICANAFYRCGGIEEIVLCGVDGADISPEAFAGCTGLKRLHTPRRVNLGSGFSVLPLACGCVSYYKE